MDIQVHCGTPPDYMVSSDDKPIPFAELARGVRLGDSQATTALYGFVSRGVGPYLSRQSEPQDFQDMLHDVFLEVLRALRQGQLRDPERLMGFIRTVARRKVAVYIDAALRNRRDHTEMATVFALASSRPTPEREVIFRQQTDIVNQILARMSGSEREILGRFYIHQQHRIQICAEMGLTGTQFRLLKWRSKARFVQLSRQRLAERRFNVTAPVPG